MSHAYYYFAASLPMLNFESEPPMEMERFIEDSQRLLLKEDYEFLEYLMSDQRTEFKSGNGTFNKILELERNFRNALAWFRAQRADKDPLDYVRWDRFNDPYWIELIHQASKEPNLMEAEKMLDRARWKCLDDLTATHYHDSESIMVYGLKLGILRHYQEIHSGKGEKIFEEIKQIEITI